MVLLPVLCSELGGTRDRSSNTGVSFAFTVYAVFNSGYNVHTIFLVDGQNQSIILPLSMVLYVRFFIVCFFVTERLHYVDSSNTDTCMDAAKN